MPWRRQAPAASLSENRLENRFQIREECTHADRPEPVAAADHHRGGCVRGRWRRAGGRRAGRWLRPPRAAAAPVDERAAPPRRGVRVHGRRAARRDRRVLRRARCRHPGHHAGGRAHRVGRVDRCLAADRGQPDRPAVDGPEHAARPDLRLAAAVDLWDRSRHRRELGEPGDLRRRGPADERAVARGDRVPAVHDGHRAQLRDHADRLGRARRRPAARALPPGARDRHRRRRAGAGAGDRVAGDWWQLRRYPRRGRHLRVEHPDRAGRREPGQRWLVLRRQDGQGHEARGVRGHRGQRVRHRGHAV